MIPAARTVVIATRQPLFAARFREVLVRAGITGDPVVVTAPRLLEAIHAHPGCLVIVDGSAAPCWIGLAEARQNAPESHFVLCAKVVTMELVQTAMDWGLDGVLFTRLPAGEAAQALIQICRGERQLRFHRPSIQFVDAPTMKVERPIPVAPDFDVMWMFECTP